MTPEVRNNFSMSRGIFTLLVRAVVPVGELNSGSIKGIGLLAECTGSRVQIASSLPGPIRARNDTASHIIILLWGAVCAKIAILRCIYNYNMLCRKII